MVKKFEKNDTTCTSNSREVGARGTILAKPSANELKSRFTWEEIKKMQCGSNGLNITIQKKKRKIEE